MFDIQDIIANIKEALKSKTGKEVANIHNELCSGNEWYREIEYVEDSQWAVRKDPIVRKVCTICYSEDVTCDASIKWDESLQDWAIVVAHFPNYWCNSCGGECLIESVPVSGPMQ